MYFVLISTAIFLSSPTKIPIVNGMVYDNEMECEKALDTIYNEKYYPEGTVVKFEIDKKDNKRVMVSRHKERNMVAYTRCYKSFNDKF